jgi:hypothetical protein
VAPARPSAPKCAPRAGQVLERTVHSEKQIQVHVAPEITVDGRIDLIRRLDTDELAIVDFKSTARAQDEDVTRDEDFDIMQTISSTTDSRQWGKPL